MLLPVIHLTLLKSRTTQEPVITLWEEKFNTLSNTIAHTWLSHASLSRKSKRGNK